MRASSLTGSLARRGFQSAADSAATIEGWELSTDAADAVIAAASRSVDPDQAVEWLGRLRDDDSTLFTKVISQETWLRQSAVVLAASATLAQHLLAHPQQLELLAETAEVRTADQLRSTLLEAVEADPAAEQPVAGSEAGDALRLAYRGELIRICARDLGASDPRAELASVAAELADLADATVEAALALARHEVGEEAVGVRLGIVALGKCGAGELNYVSDVDVLFVGDSDNDPELRVATRLASGLSRICSAHTAAGTIWQVDAALRPEGQAGPLVRTLSSHESYYEKWAKNWEFQAMLKARAMAGDRELAQQFVDMVQPKVWQVAERENFINETQAMRRRVVEHIPAKERDREIKLGEGGLRDVEFTVQLLQLVHGRTDERLRTATTLTGLERLVECGYIGREDGAELAEAYQFMRVLEHRIQLNRLRRTHLLPTAEPELRKLGRQLGLDAEGVTSGWRKRARRVQTLHRRVFYSPLLEAVARIPSGAVRLTTDAARDRLAVLGYDDPKAALGHIEAMTRGLTRQAAIQKQLLPAMLGWFAEGPNPDHGLLAFRQVSEALGRTPWYLRGLRDEGAMAERLARVLSSSRYLVDLITRNPEILSMLADTGDLVPRSRAALQREMDLIADRNKDTRAAIDAVRGVRRRELFRIGAGDLLEVTDLDTVQVALSNLAGATIDAALRIARRETPQVRLGIVAMGRWGGHELSYASDADAMFVVDSDPDQGAVVVKELRALLSRPGPEPKLVLDADLRPEGKGGPMVRTLESFKQYYKRWSSTWEAQALVRAAPGAGDEQLCTELLDDVERLRWPAKGLERTQLAEIRRLKARMEGERLPRGADPKRHLKLGPGGLSDVEWTVQMLQLQHAGRHPSLRTQRTLTALEAAEELELIESEDAEALRAAWVMASRIRDRIMLVRAKGSDSLPHDSRELAAVAELMGYAPGEASHLVADWMRVARIARGVVDRVFWDAGTMGA